MDVLMGLVWDEVLGIWSFGQIITDAGLVRLPLDKFGDTI